jgi:glycosyltransferase involved in cell wall biosynthesis
MLSNQQNTTIPDKAIHVVHLASGDLWAGAEVMLYTLAKSLRTDLDVRVTVILLNHGTLEEKLRDCGIELYILDESRLNGLHILRQLNQIIQKIKPDIIHTHRIKENILGSIVAWRNNTPSLRTTHGAPEHRPPLYKIPKQIILLLDKFLGQYVQKKIVAVSTDLAKILKGHFSASKVAMIVNGVDIKSLTQSQPSRDNENTDTYHIGIAGRLVPIKRVDLFIESAIHLKQQHPEQQVCFHVYGDGPLYNELKSQVQAQQADGYIQLEGHCENMSQALQTLDALLMTSDHEGLPMILLEAMCLQIPIIAHAVGGIPDLLDNGRCGILVHKHTGEGYAEAIINLIDSPKYRQKLAELALEQVRKKFSAEANALAYLKIYQKLSAS